jgi:hypothetical protein
MAGLLIFIGIGIIITTILKTQARRAKRRPESDRLRELHDRLSRGGDAGHAVNRGSAGPGGTNGEDLDHDGGPDRDGGADADRDDTDRDSHHDDTERD